MTRADRDDKQGDWAGAIPFTVVASLLGVVSGTVMFVGRDGRVLLGAPPQDALVGGRSMLGVIDGVLRTTRAEEDKALHAALAGLSSAQPTALVCLRSRQGVTVAVLDLRLLEDGFLVALRVTRLAPEHSASAVRLAQVFGLTQAEARVAAALLVGLNLAAIAASHGTSLETVRTHVKRLRTKTGARSQGQMTGLLLRASAAFGDDPLPGPQ